MGEPIACLCFVVGDDQLAEQLRQRYPHDLILDRSPVDKIRDNSESNRQVSALNYVHMVSDLPNIFFLLATDDVLTHVAFRLLRLFYQRSHFVYTVEEIEDLKEALKCTMT